MATKIPGNTQSILKHWHESVPDDRLAHLVRDAGRAFNKRLQVRLQKNNVSFGHWTFLRILWTSDGLTQKELSDLAGDGAHHIQRHPSHGNLGLCGAQTKTR